MYLFFLSHSFLLSAISTNTGKANQGVAKWEHHAANLFTEEPVENQDVSLTLHIKPGTEGF